ncbi:MAG: MgtC/SapB family protein [Gemmatimonadales bacterium]|nr:MgtC/SapB family protein [Gemmatimonadales bacterium]
MELSLLHQLGIALGLGLLVGLQREFAASDLAGIRTFPLITIFGTLSGALVPQMGGWVLGAGVLAIAGLIVMGNVIKLRTGEADPGITTEVAVLLMYGVGGALAAGYTTAAIVTGGGVAVLLHWKSPLHELVTRIGQADAQAIFRLALIALVILPLLPNRAFGPYGVLNPFSIWLMVVLIVGISMGAYVAYKLLGRRSGTLVAGLMGGLISSTATSVSLARSSRIAASEAGTSAVVIVIASTVVFARVLFEIAVIIPAQLAAMAPPLVAMMVVMIVLSAVLYLGARRTFEHAAQQQEPPSELGAAIVFGLLYAAVLLGVAAAKANFGQTGMYAVAGLSGLTDMDAITLSTAQLVRSGDVGADTGWRLVMVGALANLVFKGGLVVVLGQRRLGSRIAAVFGVALVAGVGLLVLWPG